MKQQAFTLRASRRERTGSRYARRLRDRGQLPAIVYGHKQEPVPIVLDAAEMVKHIRDGERVFAVELDGAEPELTLVKDLQYDYLGTTIVHVDLARVDLDERVHVQVPVHLIGDAKGLKISGAMLTQPVTDLELECSVVNLPEYLEVDVSDLDAGESITAGQVPLPFETMKLLTDPETTVATVWMQHGAEEDAESVEATDGAEPEVLTERKSEEPA